ncbi:DHH family phosphoesterase [Enterococcus montenegrensis]|uniref:DHH family phosphoesterase n=1 Tax=Enterococcus montenegrensis TaxID=3031993 RepID=UPI00249DA055|nr:DHH family phosphoesterase [Enterococcus montenegrensis]WHA09273.1 DHH family phosphoesterase [Enterococcus montenegrensis]
MKKYPFLKVMVLVFIVEFICLVFNPNLWVNLILFAAINVFVYYVYYTLQNLQALTDDQRIRKSAQIAIDNSKFLSSVSPSIIFIYQPKTFRLDWMNHRALDLNEQVGQDLLWDKTLKPLLVGSKDEGTLRVSDKSFEYIIDRQKNIVFLLDKTTEVAAQNYQASQQTAIGIISVDNYDDVVDKMDAKETSYLNSFVTTFISDWSDEYGIYLKRLNAERFYFVAHASDIKKMAQEQFSLLDKIRTAAEEQSIPLTISMGISYGDQTGEKIGEVSQTCLDIALVRGGDQVVVKEANDEAKPKFYGGKTASVTKRTRVRSRAMGTALNKILAAAEDIYIMGHRYPDMDAIGSAYGVATLADFQGKTSYVVINENELIPDVERCLQEIHKDEELEGHLISVKQALGQIKQNSLLVMVDYHKPSLSISQELYEKFDKVVIIDHHRRGEEFPTQPLLTYIESSASSASELVGELIQYQSSTKKQMDKMTATLLLAGIFVDTKNFSVRTSSRTFDIASYLKSKGANGELVQYILSSDLTSFLEISELVSKSEFIDQDIVVACASEDKVYDSVTTAKTADTLLSMNDVQASFVITKRQDGLVGISARSNGKINVQSIMEDLGGGGHFTNAATQIKEKSLNEVKTMLYNEIQHSLKQE